MSTLRIHHKAPKKSGVTIYINGAGIKAIKEVFQGLRRSRSVPVSMARQEAYAEQIKPLIHGTPWLRCQDPVLLSRVFFPADNIFLWVEQLLKQTRDRKSNAADFLSEKYLEASLLLFCTLYFHSKKGWKNILKNPYLSVIPF